MGIFFGIVGMLLVVCVYLAILMRNSKREYDISFKKTYAIIIYDICNSLTASDVGTEFYLWKDRYKRICSYIYNTEYSKLHIKSKMPGVITEHEKMLACIIDSRHIPTYDIWQLIYCGIAHTVFDDTYINRFYGEIENDLRIVVYCLYRIKPTVLDAYKECARIINYVVSYCEATESYDAYKRLLNYTYRFAKVFFMCTDKDAYRNMDYYINAIGVDATSAIYDIDTKFNIGFFQQVKL